MVCKNFHTNTHSG